jgi:branched-chain amino acid transport system ATP-binding protein
METGKIIINGEAKELLEDPRIVEAYLGKKSS